MTDWKIFKGSGDPHEGLRTLPKPPPWRFAARHRDLTTPAAPSPREEARAKPFIPEEPMILAVNAALYLRRPLLITGKPGTGKSTLISKVAHELKLGPVLRWPITSRSTLKSGLYDFDAVGRLQAKGDELPIGDYVTLGPLGTALLATDWPRALLIDEIDKSDMDFANDLLNVIEEGEFDIPELRRTGGVHTVIDAERNPVTITDGHVVAGQFPFVIMTSNAERDFPPAFLRRCIRLDVKAPDAGAMAKIVTSQLGAYAQRMDADEVTRLLGEFDSAGQAGQDISTDQLLNALFLIVAMRDAEARTFTDEERTFLETNLLRALGETR